MKTIFSIRCSFHERALYKKSLKKKIQISLSMEKRREVFSRRFSYNIDIENSLK